MPYITLRCHKTTEHPGRYYDATFVLEDASDDVFQNNGEATLILKGLKEPYTVGDLYTLNIGDV